MIFNKTYGRLERVWKSEWPKQEESESIYGVKGGFIMFKRKIITLSAIMIAGLMTFQANVSADAGILAARWADYRNDFPNTL